LANDRFQSGECIFRDESVLHYIVRGLAVWQIPVEALDSPGVRARVRQIKEGDRVRRPISVDTHTMILPGIE
jgi:hypothetical protein